MIEANRYRKKSIVELSKEGTAYREIFSKKAKENQKQSQEKGVKCCKNSDNIKPVDTKQEVAKAVGVSHGTLKKIDVIPKKNLKQLNLLWQQSLVVFMELLMPNSGMQIKGN
ncbi:MAG: hypothetical protein GY941_25475 [Planctomycetes bacterium]|nr:hypothetical protein [Planctomycetota bacterium]